ncbi:MAG: hypothetical protein ACOC56_02625 [Atribacterota bacterium]
MKNPIIRLDSEGIRILVDTDEEISKNYTISTEGAIVKCIKHLYRYKEFTMPKDIMIRILWLSFKGLKCKTHHLDISQRDALYQYFKDKEIDDPYIKEFMKQSKEIFKN